MVKSKSSSKSSNRYRQKALTGGYAKTYLKKHELFEVLNASGDNEEAIQEIRMKKLSDGELDTILIMKEQYNLPPEIALNMISEYDVDLETLKNHQSISNDGVLLEFGSGQGFYVFPDTDNASSFAFEQAKYLLEEAEHTAEALKDYIWIGETDIRLLSVDMANQEISDLSHNELMKKAQELKNEHIYSGEIKTLSKNKLEDELSYQLSNYYAKRLNEDPYEFLVEERGDYPSYTEELIKQHWIEVDFDRFTNDTLDNEGFESWIAGADGQSNDVRTESDGWFYYYRFN